MSFLKNPTSSSSSPSPTSSSPFYAAHGSDQHSHEVAVIVVRLSIPSKTVFLLSEKWHLNLCEGVFAPLRHDETKKNKMLSLPTHTHATPPPPAPLPPSFMRGSAHRKRGTSAKAAELPCEFLADGLVHVALCVAHVFREGMTRYGEVGTCV